VGYGIIKIDLNEIGCELDAVTSGLGPMACCFENDNKLSGSMKGEEFLD
jgi:hypothetical protein